MGLSNPYHTYKRILSSKVATGNSSNALHILYTAKLLEINSYVETFVARIPVCMSRLDMF